MVDQRLAAQQIGNAGRHVADFGAGRLGMPAGEQGVVERARSFLDLERLTNLAGNALVLAEAEQPIERDLVFSGHVEQRLGPRKARRRSRQQLGQCRAVHSDGSRERGLARAGTLQKRLQTISEQNGEVALVHPPRSMCTLHNDCLD
jgi:hypothetical protein